MQLIDEPGRQILPQRAHAAAQPDVLRPRRRARLTQRRLDSIGHEMERRAALHLERLARVVCEHEHRGVVGRVLAPPAAPTLIGPGTTHGAEHVAPDDPRADVLEAASGEVVVDTGFAATLAEDRRTGHELARRAGRKHPLVQRQAALAKRRIPTLIRSRAVAVDRQSKRAHR